MREPSKSAGRHSGIRLPRPLRTLAGELGGVESKDLRDVLRVGFRKARARAMRRLLRSRVWRWLDGTRVHVGKLLAVGGDSYYIEGWIFDRYSKATRLTMISPDGDRVELADCAFWYSRPGEPLTGLSSEEQLASNPRFISYFALQDGSRLRDGATLELRTAGGSARILVSPRRVSRSEAGRLILRDLASERVRRDELARNHVSPAMMRLQETLESTARVEKVAEYGVPPVAPEVSVIVALYRRIDLIEHQFAQFVQDPEIREAELLYVLDSPEQANQLHDYAAQMFSIYGVPFRVAYLNQNSGFALANNLGASVARGRLLILMNSDVFPERAGWVGRLCSFYDSTPQIGTLGPKLLHEDGTIQHAGIYFDRPRGAAVWTNEHYFKGFHRSFSRANVTKQVPAVSAACMMISAARFADAGGLRGIFIQGDFEDSDLCLRLAEAGYENWYYPEVELYHLEGQSYESESRALNWRYNTWLHTALWEHRLKELDTADQASHAERANG